MKIINKKLGETPLRALCRLRAKNKKLSGEKLSYMGRLDPMAEGKMIVLVGDKENKERARYLGFDKEYEVVFLLGVSTDSGDILGLIQKVYEGRPFVKTAEIRGAVGKLKKIKKQKYPWMSGKTIGGVKMFRLYKEGMADGVERPENKIEIKYLRALKTGSIGAGKLGKEIEKRISATCGDFRQREIVGRWREFLEETALKKFQIFSLTARVSSGTFIRGFAEYFEESLGVPCLVYSLKRTKIFL